MKQPKLNPLGAAALVAPLLLVYYFSTSPAYHFHEPGDTQMVVSFKTLTANLTLCGEEEQKEFEETASHRRSHMQRKSRVCGSRERVPLRLDVWLDGQQLTGELIQPSGLQADGVTFVFKRYTFPAGAHAVKVAAQDYRADGSGQKTVFERTLALDAARVTVIDYDPERQSFFIHT
ncbi:MAG: hypothetical protein HY804_03510 [Nitrospinae bacterium]|nr:hypothetical protein [Nitrospinota bacterium]